MKIVVLTLALAGFGPVSGGTTVMQQAAVASAGCRVYSTDETRVSKTGTLQIKCVYDTSTNQHVCQEKHSGGYSFVQTTQFGSVADFVADISRVVFFPHATAIIVRFPGSTSTQNYSYDARGYLTTIATASNAGTGGSMVQTFTAWDAFGRPISGHDEKQDYALTYDDGQRLVTLKAGALPSVITLKLDDNGNQLESTTVNPTFKDQMKVTIHATQQICK